MRFRIDRASDWKGKEAPVEGAIRGEKEFGSAEWFVDVEDLDALMSLYDKAGAALIVDRHDICIYDDYVE